MPRLRGEWLIFWAALLVLASCSKSASDWIKKGTDLFSAGNYAEAELNYRKAIQKEPNLGEAHYRLGLVLLKQSNKTGAHGAFTQSVVSAPDLDDAKVRLADLELEAYWADPLHPRRPYDVLKRISMELLAKNPQSVDGLRIQGNLALIDRRPAEARAAFRAANDVEPLRPEVVHGLMQALEPTNQTGEAEKLALALIAKDKTYGLIYDDLYAIYQATGRPAEAERIFRTKVANNPNVAAYRLQLAAHFINLGKKAEMETALQPLRDDAKTFPTGGVDVGEFYMRLGMWDEAKTIFEEAARSDPSNRLVARKRLVQALVGLGRMSDAVQVADETVKEFPQDSECRLVRASMWLDTGEQAKITAATKELEQIRKEKDWGKRPMFWYVLGRAYQQAGDNNKALAAFESATRLNPAFQPALVALIKLRLSGGESKLALEYANQALAINRADAEVKLLHATALLQARRLDEARAELTALTRADPRSEGAQLQLGLTLAAQQRYQEAEAVFKKLYRPGQSDLRPLEGLAAAYAARGQGLQAIELLSADLKQSPNPNRVREIFGKLALMMKRPEIAIEQYTELTRAEPNAARNYYLLAQALRVKGDVPAAIANLETAEKLDPNDAGALSILAVLLQGSGRNSEAARRFRRILELRPGDVNTMNNLAYALAESGGDLDEAKQLAQKVVRAAPDQRAYADTLGWIYLKIKMTDSALQIFQNLVKKEPKNPAYLYHLAVAQLEKGQKAEGRATLEAALKNHPSQSIQVQIQNTMARGEKP